jgi:hypothetical protein
MSQSIVRIADVTISPAPDAEAGQRWATWLIMLAVALLGIAHIAFLPPFEGFDEQAHLSYIQQVADSWTVPQLGSDKLSTDVEAYPGPLPYPSRPPFETGDRLSYRSFFARALPSLPQAVERFYRPGSKANWEAQHPPLYYLAMAPVYRLGQNWSWNELFLLLRSVSWAMAFAGFAIGSRATQRLLATMGTAPMLRLLVPAWPLLFPEFFPEMARLGNDGLCLLLVGVAWHLLLRLLNRRSAKIAALLGLVLGLGLLTKAFFVPITGGIGALLAFVALRDRDARYLLDVAVVLGAAVALGGGWYYDNLRFTGSLIGANDFLRAEAAGGGWGGLVGGFSPRTFLHGIGGIAVSFVWAGSWSFGRFSPIYSLPLVLLAVLPFVDWLTQLRRASNAVIAPLFVVGPVLFGLIYHWLNQMTLGTQASGTPGWYLHLLQGPLALALVIGWRWRLVLAALAVYALAFHVVCWAMQLSLFSGCAYKSGDYKYVEFGPCLIEPARLAVLAEPQLGAVALGLALAAGLGGLAWGLRKPPRFPDRWSAVR